MKARLYINGIYWTSYAIPGLVPYLYVALHGFHDTEIFYGKPIYTETILPVMTFTYKHKENMDACYSLIRIDN